MPKMKEGPFREYHMLIMMMELIDLSTIQPITVVIQLLIQRHYRL